MRLMTLTEFLKTFTGFLNPGLPEHIDSFAGKYFTRINPFFTSTMETKSSEQLNKIDRIKHKRRQQSHDRAIAAAKILSGLPKTVDPITLASFRLQEIKSIEEELVNSVKNRKRRLFQTLPRYLRRRTASYNSNRVPSAYRAQAAAEFETKGELATVPPKKSHKGPKNKQNGISKQNIHHDSVALNQNGLRRIFGMQNACICIPNGDLKLP